MNVIKEIEEKALMIIEEYEITNDDDLEQAVFETVDNAFIYVDAKKSIDMLEQIPDEFIEDDSGIWENKEPIEAIKAQAFFSYMNALRNEVKKLLKKQKNNKKNIA